MTTDRDPHPIADVLQQMRDSRERHPVTRTGEREPIPYDTRLAVYKRDGWTCRLCGTSFRGRDLRDGGADEDRLNLDHLVPWSAGGSDYGENLRTLCGQCNQDRSNYREAAAPRVLPVTWWCVDCHNPDRWPKTRPDWIRRPWFAADNWPQDEPQVRAYCGWCDFIGYTIDPLCI